MPDPDNDVIIVGGGIAGLACGIALASEGLTVRIYERAAQLRPIGAAIGLFPNGLTALSAISEPVHRKVLDAAVELHRMRVKNSGGETVRDTDLSTTDAVTPRYLVWYLLQRYLAEGVPQGSLVLGQAFEAFSVDPETGLVHVRVGGRTAGGAAEVRSCRVLIGADGIRSAVRMQLFGPVPLVYHGVRMFRAALNTGDVDAAVVPPPGHQVTYQGDAQGQSFSFRDTGEGVLTFTAIAPSPDAAPLPDAAARKRELQGLCSGYPRDVRHVVDRVRADVIYENAVEDIDVLEEWARGPVVLLGDAVHAMTPYLGQGANLALEDACELARCVAPALRARAGPAAIETALARFGQRRRLRVGPIHAVSRERLQKARGSFTADAMATRFSKETAEFRRRLYYWVPSPHGVQACACPCHPNVSA